MSQNSCFETLDRLMNLVICGLLFFFSNSIHEIFVAFFGTNKNN